jgi:hypothetical protein
MRVARRLAPIAALLASVSATASAQFTVFNSRPAWEAALAGLTIHTEDFNQGNNSAPDAPGLGVSALRGAIQASVWRDLMDDLTGIPGTTWSFASPGGIAGFGGNFDLAGPGGNGSGIAVSVVFAVGGSGVIGEIPDVLIGEFWGFTTTNPVSQVVFAEGTQSTNFFAVESYELDNLSYAVAGAVALVPEPATVVLTAAGLVATAACARRRRAR